MLCKSIALNHCAIELYEFYGNLTRSFDNIFRLIIEREVILIPDLYDTGNNILRFMTSSDLQITDERDQLFKMFSCFKCIHVLPPGVEPGTFSLRGSSSAN